MASPRVPGRVAHVPRGGRPSVTGLLATPLSRCLAAGLLSAFSPRVLGHPSTKAFFRRLSSAEALRPNSFYKELKGHITDVRLALLSGELPSRQRLGQILPRILSSCRNRKQLMQFTRIGRALPLREVAQSDIDDFHSRISSEFLTPVPESLVRKVNTFPVPPLLEAIPADYVSPASCLERTRKEGGRASLLRLDRPRPRPKLEHSSLNRTVNACFLLDQEDELPNHAASLAIPELGCKVRIVTKHPASVVAKSHRGRRSLWTVLDRYEHISVSESISDSELQELYFPKAPQKSKVFSADLSAATDYLGHPFIRSICDHMGIPFQWVSALTVDGVKVTRGTSMGLPSSWPVLSLAHYAICSVVDPGHSFRIKGDDLIALWTDRMINHYYHLCSQVGFVPNLRKSVVSPVYGMFCEVSYRRFKKRLVRESDFSLRSFVKDEPSGHDVWMMAHRNGASMRRLNRLYKTFHRSWILLANKHRVNPYACARIGGLEFPPKNLDKEIPKRESALVRAVHNGIALPVAYEATGALSAAYLAKFAGCRWAVSTSDELTKLYEKKLSILLVRASFFDAQNGTYRDVSLKRNAKVRRLASFMKRYGKVAPEPFPTSYRKMYEVLLRLNVVDDCPIRQFYPYRMDSDSAYRVV